MTIFLSLKIVQVPSYTIKGHTTVHPKTSNTPITTTTTSPTTITEKVPLSFQGFLSDSFQNSTYIVDDKDSVDVKDNENDHDDIKWSSLPIIDPPSKKQLLDTEYVNDLFSIEDILQRNESDWKKLDEIIDKVNETGTLTQVNVSNATRRIDNDVDILESSASPSEQTFTYLQPPKPNQLENPNDEQTETEPNAKDLKVQFVLDCDFIDATGSPNDQDNRFPPASGTSSASAPPYYLSPNMMRYPPDIAQSVFNIQRVSTTKAPTPIQSQPQKYTYTTRSTAAPSPTRKKGPTKHPATHRSTKPPSYPSEDLTESTDAVFYYPEKFELKPTTTVKPTTNRPVKAIEVKPTKKPAVKNIYVDPPVVAVISDTFEYFYNYFENALTTKVRVKPKDAPKRTQSIRRSHGKKRPIKKRSTAINRIPVTETTVPIFYASTEQPNYHRYTQNYAGQNGQKLTTNIQVTSEYVGKDPVTERPGADESSSSDSDYGGGDYFGDDYSSQSDSTDEKDDVTEEESSDSSSDYGISVGDDVSDRK